MGPGMFDGFFAFVGLLMILCVIFVPLGAWKLIEIIIWVCHHVHIGIAP
jgi:hypothetical protein